MEFELREYRADETEKRMELMDLCFGFKRPEQKFIHILPKLYGPKNTTARHFGVILNGEPVTSIGVYPMTMISPYGKLNAACIGAVSTHPDCRKQGYFTKTLNYVISECKRAGLELLFLGGKRTRYNHFGFECAGSTNVFEFSDSELLQSERENVSYVKIDPSDRDTLQKCLNLYNKKSIRMERNADDFYECSISWNASLYAVFCENSFVGYFSCNNDRITEMGWDNGCFKKVLACAVCEKTREYHESILDVTDEMIQCANAHRLDVNEMFNVLDYKKTIEFMGGEWNAALERDINDENIDSLAKIRHYCGFAEHPGAFKTGMYVGVSDEG